MTETRASQFAPRCAACQALTRISSTPHFFSRLTWIGMACFALVSLAEQLRAEDTHVVTTVRQLELIEGRLPGDDPDRVVWRRAIPPVRVRLDGDGEAYVEPYAKPGAGRPAGRPSRDLKIAIRVAVERDIQGTLFWPVRDGETVSVKFRVDRATAAATTAAEHARAFHEIKGNYYGRLLEEAGPGAAWFRHQVLESRRALGHVVTDITQLTDEQRRTSWSELERSFDLLSGEQALHENLQLDRQLGVTAAARDEIDVQSIAGITVREFDWSKAVKDRQPAKDRLARYVPADQHAVFFPSFAALTATLDRLDALGGATLRVMETRSEEHGLRRRYERQLGLTMGAVARLLGPRLIGAVAVTGGDPYFRAGTDVAVLLEPAANVDSATLEQLITAQIAAAVKEEQGVAASESEIAGVRYAARRSPDRRVSSYVARIDDVVVVTNSPMQLRRLIDVAQGRFARLDSLDEFTFFRDRYKLGAIDETALVVISDATIRRWCGPVWRIGASRRIRAAAVIAEIQATHADSLVTINSAEVPARQRPPLENGESAGELTWQAGGVASTVFGSLEFQTPISESNVSRVTTDEARLYGQWRDQYQAYWQRFFDPIAIRIGAESQKLSFDMTVMPLIDRTNYAIPRELVGKSSIPPEAGDRHAGTLIQAIMSVDKQSKSSLLELSKFLFGPNGSAGDIRKWLGPTVTVYVDDDPIWERLAQATPDQLFNQDNLAEARLPIALRLDVTNQEALTVARLNMRKVMGNIPGIAGEWKTRSHRRQEYYVYTPTEVQSPQFISWKLQVFTLAAGDQWLLTLNEGLLKRAIDRQLDREAGRDKADSGTTSERKVELARTAWLGEQIALEIDGQSATMLRGWLAMNYGRQAQLASWRNLPILNEWKRRYPSDDPVKIHERLWHVRLTCPGGGEYRWNEKLQTMQSSFFGSPDDPRNDLVPPPLFEQLKRLGFGMTFEADGIRARGVFEEKKSPRTQR